MNNNSSISQEEWEQLESYLRDEMSAEERETFAARLAVDADLQQKLNETRLLLLGIREAALENSLSDFHKELEREKKPAPVKKLSFTRWIAAAAIIALLVFAGIFISRSSGGNEKIFSDYFEADPGLPTVMGASEDYEFSRGMVDYKTGKYAEAIKRWKPLLAASPTSDTLNYFTGVAFLSLEQPDSALFHLERSMAAADGDFLTDAAWYAALALIAKNKKEEAIYYLKQAVHPRKEELLSRLK